MVNYGLALRKPFTDVKTLVIGIIISMIPIVNLLSFGFIFRSSGVGKDKSKDKMPEWGDWFNTFITGLLGIIAHIIYMIPALIVFTAGAGIAAGSLMGSFAMSPELAEMVASEEIPEEAVGAFFEANWPAFANALLTAAPVILFGILLVLLALFMAPMGVLGYVKSGKYSDAFALKAIATKCFTGQYFVAWLAAAVIGMIIKAILILVPFIGYGLGLFISGIIAYSILGQVYAEIKK